MKINSLLNPEPQCMPRRWNSLAQRRTKESEKDASSEYLPQTPSPKIQKPKEAKDAPKFERGEPMGKVRYPPHEIDDERVLRQLKRFCIFPRHDIGEYPRHIPYNSEKKDFLLKTGRKSFEVFHYTFRYGEGGKDCKEWTVMWDYNIGLVRITPFFKALNHAKTVPNKVICVNTGLKDICHSITGGALAAQGYWMPFEAAKAVAATFCWNIRYALTPIFGIEFLDLCTDCEDPDFKRFTIDERIVEQCIRESSSWRRFESHRSPSSLRKTIPSGCSGRPTLKSDWLPAKTLRPRSTKIYDFDNVASDSDKSEECTVPSHPSTRARSTAVNTSVLPKRTRQVVPSPSPFLSSVPSSTPILGLDSPKTKRTLSDTDYMDDDPSSRNSSEEAIATRKRGKFETDEARAAYMLIKLSVEDSNLVG